MSLSYHCCGNILWIFDYRKFCKECGIPIYILKGPNQKYCETCSQDLKRENARLRKQKQRKRQGFSNKKELGTSNFGSHAKSDFKMELSLILKEKRRIGI